MLGVTHLHAVIKDTVRDESFVVAPLLLQSARELESWLDVNTDKAVAFMLQWKSVMQPCSGLNACHLIRKRERKCGVLITL